MRRLLPLICLLAFAGASRAQSTIFVPTCSGTDDTAAFSAIITGASGNPRTIEIPYKVSSVNRCAINPSTLSAIASNITIDNSNGSGINVLTGTLTVNGDLVSPPSKTNWFGVGTIVFNGKTFASSADARFTDTRTPTDGSVTDAKITGGGLSPSKIAGTAVITTDARLPTSGQKDALAGTSGTPSSSNKYVTQLDPLYIQQNLPIGATAPSSPSVGDQWLSSSLAHVQVSQRAADRSIALSPTEVWEQNGVAEMNIYKSGSTFYMIYRGGNGSPRIGYATASSIDGTWTKQNSALPIIGGGAGGVAGAAVQPSTLVVGSTVNIYWTDNAVGSINVATATASTPASVTQVGTVLAASGTKKFYNSSVIADSLGVSGAAYLMAVEVGDSASTHAFQIALYTSSSPTGTFSLLRTLTLFPPNGTSASTASGPRIAIENGQYVMFFHGGTSASLPTEMYRATSSDLTTFTLDSNKFIGRADIREYDQAADPEVYTDGHTVDFFWEGVNNANPISPIAPASVVTAWSYIYHSKASRTFVRYNGSTWDVAPLVNTSSERKIIAERKLGAAQSSIDIENIDQGYETLILEVQTRCDDATTQSSLRLRFNSDTGANYYSGGLRYLGPTPTLGGTEDLGATSMVNFGAVPANTATAGLSGYTRAEIPNYSQVTTWQKMLWSESNWAIANTTTNQLGQRVAGRWASTAAINRITLTLTTGNFMTGTIVKIYGVR